MTAVTPKLSADATAPLEPGEQLAEQIEAKMTEVVELLGQWRDATERKWAAVGFGSRPAIVVIDLARFWTEPGYAAYCPGAEEAIAATNELLAHARAAGVPVIFTTQAYQSTARGLVSATGMARKFPGSDTLAVGSVATELHPSLTVEEGEHLVVKTQSSAFAHTYLSTVLHDAGVDTVILTGVVTSGCVRATAADSLANGFRTIVVPEAVADHLPGAHTWTLFDISTKIGDVVPLAEATAYLDRVAAER
ncbi:N-carbamoylsarcosine amidohydrolase [Luteimicrobium xylanilyticum]|uniref:Maleamate amidohydrolase n=1 Tax=Luteimicrobium xylanilyticum TaxID=1133546 RepID=A0A5P9Q6K8_9MICO|nr:isochorismatase family protein [Luteimicrobium xylanilyticum]QFU96712.1 Maleamate amidohydrolase [Luteimicrobium xylanilyticum]